MKARPLFLTFLLSVVLTATYAQTAESWQQVLTNVMTLEDEQPEDWEELMTQMEELAEQPRDINQMTRDDWETLPFLTPLMVEQLVEYRDR